MATLTIRKTWQVNRVFTAAAMTLGIVRDDTGATVVSAGTVMPLASGVSAGIYEYTTTVDGGTTYTATITVVYGGQTYTFTVVAVPEITAASVQWPCGFETVLNQLMSLMILITVNPKPSYSVHGHSYSWNEYTEMLGRQIEQFTKLNAQANPFEFVTRG